MMRATGFQDEDFTRPLLGSLRPGPMLPRNMHIDGLARTVEQGVNAAGGKGIIFNTITISDGISNGTEGMKYPCCRVKLLPIRLKRWSVVRPMMA